MAFGIVYQVSVSTPNKKDHVVFMEDFEGIPLPGHILVCIYIYNCMSYICIDVIYIYIIIYICICIT